MLQYSRENTFVGVGSLFLIKLQAQWLLLIGLKFTLKNACVNLDSRTTETEGVWITVMLKNQKSKNVQEVRDLPLTNIFTNIFSPP